MIDADLDLENIGSEYRRSENSILKPIVIENTNQGITASPSKRNDREGMYWNESAPLKLDLC